MWQISTHKSAHNCGSTQRPFSAHELYKIHTTNFLRLDRTRGSDGWLDDCKVLALSSQSMIPAIVEALGPSLDNKNQPLQIHTQARIPDVYARKIEREIWSLSNTINSAKTVEIAGLYDSMVSAYEQLQHTEFGLLFLWVNPAMK